MRVVTGVNLARSPFKLFERLPLAKILTGVRCLPHESGFSPINNFTNNSHIRIRKRDSDVNDRPLDESYVTENT